MNTTNMGSFVLAHQVAVSFDDEYLVEKCEYLFLFA